MYVSVEQEVLFVTECFNNIPPDIADDKQYKFSMILDIWRSNIQMTSSIYLFFLFIYLLGFINRITM